MGIRALGRLLGWPAHIMARVATVRPVAPRLGSDRGLPRNHSAEEQRLCNGSCNSLVAPRAPWDALLYEWVFERFSEFLEGGCVSLLQNPCYPSDALRHQ